MIMRKLFKIFNCFFICLCLSIEVKANDNITNYLESFIIDYDNKTIIGDIDNKKLTIVLRNVEYTSQINSVKYKLSNGCYIIDKPKDWLNNWRKDEILTIINSQGIKKNYKVILPDFIRQNKNDYVIGYIPMDYFNFENNISNIKWKVLTHINLAFVYVKSNGELNDIIIRDKINNIIRLAHKNGVKVLFSLRSDENGDFYNAIKNEFFRNKLVDNIINYADKYNFDGFDIDYEVYDKVCPELVSFVQLLYNRKKRKLIQTCAVANWNPIKEGGYTNKWHKYFDIINIMTYDYTGTWSSEGQHSPFDKVVNSINMWIKELDAPNYKITMGLPFYGYTWDKKYFKSTPTSLSYDQIIKTYSNENVHIKDQVGRTYYNGKTTIRRKCLKAKEMGLAGVMIWQILHDSKDDNYSLMNTIDEVFNY